MAHGLLKLLVMSHHRFLAVAVLSTLAAACTAADSDEGSSSALALEPACPGTDPDGGTTSGRHPTGPGLALGLAGTREAMGPAAIGAHWVRSEFRWDAHQPTKATTEAKPIKDDFVKNAHKGGAQVLGVLAYAPLWARDADCQANAWEEKKQMCRPTTPADFGRYAGMMARHYKDLGGGAGVHAWEIWNEPNSKWFFQPQPDPAFYAEMLKAAYDAIHAVDKDAVIVAGATASLGIYHPGNDFNPSDFIDPRLFLRGIYEHGGKGKFDAVSHHPYQWTTVGAPNNDENWWSMFGDPAKGAVDPKLPSLRTIMDNHGDRDKNLWVTEYGIPGDWTTKTGRVMTQDDQSDLLIDAYLQWRKYDGAGPFLYFNYQDFDTDSKTDSSAHYGLVTSHAGEPGCKDGKPTGTAKKAYCVFGFLSGIK